MHRTITALAVGFVIILTPAIIGEEWEVRQEYAKTGVIPVAEAAGVTEDGCSGLEPVSQVWVTAYSSTPEETDDTPFLTARGTAVRQGIVATNFLPFGSRIKLPGLFGDQVFTVEDRMHSRKKDFVDIWMPSKEEAEQFGIHRAEIVVLD